MYLGIEMMSQPNVNLEIKFTQMPINLNVHEIGVILSALQELNLREENRIACEYGSVPALYNKLYSYWERMDTSETGLRYDVVPSF